MGGSYLLQSLRSKGLRNPSLRRPDKPKAALPPVLPRVESLHGLKLPQIKHMKRAGEGSLEKLSKPSPRLKVEKSPLAKRYRENLEGVLNCSKLENEDKSSVTGLKGPLETVTADPEEGEDFMKSEEYIRKAKRYRLEDLDDEDDTFRDSTLPISKLVMFLDNIGWNYSVENLSRHRTDLNLVVAQPFEAVCKAQVVNQVIQLVFVMIKYNLIEEDVDYLNAVSLLLQAFPWLIAAGESISVKMATKILDKLETIVATEHHLNLQSCLLISQFFTESVQKTKNCWSSPPLLAKGLRLVRQVYQRLLELTTDDFDLSGGGVHQFTKQTQYSIVPFFEAIFEDRRVVDEFSAGPDADGLRDLVDWATFKVLSLDSSSFTSVKRTILTMDLFGIVLSVLKHPKLAELSQKVNQSTLGTVVEYLLSTIVTVLDVSLFLEPIRERLSLLLKTSIQAITQSVTQEIDLLPLMQLLFKLLTERNYALTTPGRIDFALELTLFMRDLACARKEQFVSLYRNQKKPLELLVFNFSSATSANGRKEFNRLKEMILRPLVELIGLLKSEKVGSLLTLRD